MVAQQSSGTDDSVHVTARHYAPYGQGNAYDLIRRLTGSVHVGPVHSRHAVSVAPFSGDLKAVSS